MTFVAWSLVGRMDVRMVQQLASAMPYCVG